MNANGSTTHCAIVVVFMILSGPAAAFYSQVTPSLKVGIDCLGHPSLLAPKLTACAIPGSKTRIWCPDGRMFEGASEQRDPAASIARSLCGMAQVP